MNQQTSNRLQELIAVYGAALSYIEARAEPLYKDNPEVIEDFYNVLVQAVHSAAPEGEHKNIAAQQLRAIPSEKRSQASRDNGRKGGRKPKSKH